MKAVESSLSYRAVGDAFRWAARCVSCSLTGRTLARVGRGLRPAFADSRSFGTGRIRSVPLDASSASRPSPPSQARLSPFRGCWPEDPRGAG